jgi:hypothetical protein
MQETNGGTELMNDTLLEPMITPKQKHKFHLFNLEEELKKQSAVTMGVSQF